MIAASRLVRRFGPRVVVNDVSFSVGRGEIVALLGPNGAGKTTTLRMLAGLISPSAGSIAIDGTPMTRATGGVLRQRIGFLTEAPGLWDRLTLQENLAVYTGLYKLKSGGERMQALLEAFDLARHVQVRAAELSKGMRQKVALARALLHSPDVLLLDEPTSGLDPEVTRTVREMLEERRAGGCAILVSTHNLDEAERMADRVAVIQERLVAIDRPEALRRRLTSGRIVIRMHGPAAAFLDVARGIAARADADGAGLVCQLTDPDRQTPALVRALVAAGAELVEVRPEVPRLEDVYLTLLAGERPEATR